MKLLALDISSNTGWAFFDGPTLISFGLISKTKESFAAYGDYPFNFVDMALDVTAKMVDLIKELKPEVVVIEEVNKPGRFGSRFSQKMIDNLHCLLLLKLKDEQPKIKYINTSDWRKTLKLSVSETKKLAKPYQKQLSQLKTELDKATKLEKPTIKAKLEDLKKVLKEKCIHGKIDKKSISVAYVNARYGLSLKKGDNDISDAISQGTAYRLGCPVISNDDIFNNK